LETLFSVIESNWRTLIAYLGRGLRWLQNAETEVENSREWLTQVTAQYNRELESLPQFAWAAPSSMPSSSTGGRWENPERPKADELAEQRVKIAEVQLTQDHQLG